MGRRVAPAVWPAGHVAHHSARRPAGRPSCARNGIMDFIAFIKAIEEVIEFVSWRDECMSRAEVDRYCELADRVLSFIGERDFNRVFLPSEGDIQSRTGGSTCFEGSLKLPGRWTAGGWFRPAILKWMASMKKFAATLRRTMAAMPASVSTTRSTTTGPRPYGWVTVESALATRRLHWKIATPTYYRLSLSCRRRASRNYKGGAAKLSPMSSCGSCLRDTQL